MKPRLSARSRSKSRRSRRRICFVTGTRAEFGLMQPVLKAIQAHRFLQLQLIATGMHLDRSRGRSLAQIQREGWPVDAIVPWDSGDWSQTAAAIATGTALSRIAARIAELKTDILLVVGDRVEAFAAAAAAHISGCLVAHVHGGDRALGLVDDSLRHAITKLAHVHFPATPQSAKRILRMGEDSWRIIRAGSPGLDGISRTAASANEMVAEFPALRKGHFGLVVIHPESPDERQAARLARSVLQAVHAAGLDQTVVLYPNNDPGSPGIVGLLDRIRATPKMVLRRHLPRPLFLGLLRDAMVLVGNSSSGIIEAASFGTPVIDVGTRQTGRECGSNVVHLPGSGRGITRAIERIWNDGRPRRFAAHNIYGGNDAARTIADSLASISPTRFERKLIAY